MWILVIIYIGLLIISIFFTKYARMNIVIENLGTKQLGERCGTNLDCAAGNVCCNRKPEEKKDSSGNVIMNNLGVPEIEYKYYDKYLSDIGYCSIPCVSAGSWCDYTGNFEKRECANKNEDENQDTDFMNTLSNVNNEIDSFLKRAQGIIISMGKTINNNINNSIESTFNKINF